MMSRGVMTLLSLVVLASILQNSFAQSILSQSDTKLVHVGDSVSLECRVSSDVENSNLTWEFITHDLTIYKGGLLMTNNPTKYSIMRPADATVINYNLQILEVEKSDQGFYKCAIDGTQDHIIIHLDVLEKPDIPNVTPEMLNRTACCAEQGLSSTCQSVCAPAALDSNTNDLLTLCNTDGTEGLIKLMHCLTAGSNHDNCCLVRNLNPICIPFCHNEIPEDFGLQHLECLNNVSVDVLATCTTEGFATLPSQPQDVLVIPSHNGQISSIQVKWKPPARNADKVTGYKIMYKRSDLDKYFSVIVGSIKRYAKLSGLNIIANRGYDVHVAALAEHGASGASAEISIFIPDSSLNINQRNSIDACCMDRQVSDQCRMDLCQSKTWAKLDINALSQCFNKLDDVFTCLVGERDHSSCCQAFGVAPDCIPMCSGSPPPFNNSLIVCIQQMAVIEACVQQGYEKLPAPPNNLELQNVGIDEASVTFKSSPSIDVARYVVLLKAGYSQDGMFKVYGYLNSNDQAVLLSNLTAETFYSVHITAESATAGSLPSETLHFLTYPESSAQPTVPPVVNVPHNFSACCYSKMPAICAIGCEYISNITSYYKDHLDDCYAHIGSVLSCGADGRDHQVCCARRDIYDPICRELCGIATDGPLDNKYIDCIRDTPKAVACFEEGIVDLPRYPEAYVSAVSQNTITVKWSHPQTSSLIDTYIVNYRVYEQPPFKEERTNQTLIILHNLQPGTQYEIDVRSQNENGTSVPSPFIRQFTQSSETVKPNFNKTHVTGRKFWANITHCCENSGISSNCMDQCLNKQSDSLDNNNCIFDSLKMLACYADGQDHGDCCAENDGFPEECIAVCRGHTMETTVNNAICMGHGFKDVIFSCYLQNAGLIPGPPINMYVELKREMTVEVFWDKPMAYCSVDCQSIIHYWKEDPDYPLNPISITTIVGVNSPHEVTVTGTEGYYIFTVTAKNTYGSSRPSSQQRLFVSPYRKDVKVSLLNDKPYVEKGKNAILQCRASDFNPRIPYTRTWLFNDRRKMTTTSSSGSELYLTAVDPVKDEGTYSCHVKDAYIEVTDSLFLPIQYAPTYSEHRVETALPGQGFQGKVACWFNGFPDSDAGNWKKDGKPIRVDTTKYSPAVDSRYDKGITSYRLKIANLVSSDYGTYSIDVSNKFGKSSCTLSLRNPEEITPITPAKKVADPKACCAKAGVSELCQELCSLDVDVAETVADPKYETCLASFTTLISCGADGRDHRKCCQQKAVKPFCLPFCAGVSPGSHITDQLALLDCVSEAQTIFGCFEEGHKYIPYPPTDVTASWWESATTILVRWSRPKFNHDLIQSYVIYYKSSSSKMEKHVGVNEHVLEYIIDKPTLSDNYQISVVASNKWGQSLRSNVVNLEAYSVSPPADVKAGSSSTTAIISWTPAPGATSYTVHYKKKNSSRYLKIEKIQGTKQNLDSLEESTEYSVYVTSTSSKGHQSAPSKYVTFTTSTATATTAPPETKSGGSKGDDNNEVAIGVGVFIAVIVVVVIAIVIFIIVKGRSPFKPRSEAVAFENPMSGNSGGVKIQGMAGSSETDFDYGRLEEEAVYDNPSPGLSRDNDNGFDNLAYAGQTNEQAAVGAATLEINSDV